MIVHIFVKTLPAKHLLQSDRKIFHTNDLAVLWGVASRYKVQYFPEIDRLINSQTIDTMIANKLVAITDRSAQHKTIAGRDIYDIHHFFVQGYPYNPAVIQERTGLEPAQYFAELFAFIKKHVTQTIINEDLNSLLPKRKFQHLRKILIPETLALLEREMKK